MTKQKTRKELEEELRDERIKISRSVVFLLGSILGVLLMVISHIAIGQAPSEFDKLETQLSKCQEQVPVWTLNYKCEVLHDDFETNLYFVTKTEYYSFEFNDYNSYKLIKERFEKRSLENCEVIE